MVEGLARQQQAPKLQAVILMHKQMGQQLAIKSHEVPIENEKIAED